MNVTVLDYGAGNLHSIVKALDGGSLAVRVTDEPHAAIGDTLLVLPGVGAFGAAAARLAPGLAALRAAILAGQPCLGVCLGMQLLFDSSEEGEGAGLGIFRGRVTRLAGRRVPHMGWNTLEPARDDGIAWPAEAYFAHGYACAPEDPAIVTAWCTHESQRFPAIVRSGRVAGVQFHPEKSGERGVAALRALASELAHARTEAR